MKKLLDQISPELAKELESLGNRRIYTAGQEIFAEGGPYPSAAVATEKTVLLQLPRKMFLKVLTERPEMALAVIGWMSEMLRDKTATIRNLAIASPEHRIGNV